jgi:hypothetical protein
MTEVREITTGSMTNLSPRGRSRGKMVSVCASAFEALNAGSIDPAPRRNQVQESANLSDKCVSTARDSVFPSPPTFQETLHEALNSPSAGDSVYICPTSCQSRFHAAVCEALNLLPAGDYVERLVCKHFIFFCFPVLLTHAFSDFVRVHNRHTAQEIFDRGDSSRNQVSENFDRGDS